MSVFESPDIVYRETRKDALVGAAVVMARHRDSILAVRIGATDLCSAYGLRRLRAMTIYDPHLVVELIGDIVNNFGRVDGSAYAVSGPVWEYFSGIKRMWKTQLRTTPFEEHHARELRQGLIANKFDGLIREVMLDQANELTGKTVIHPTQDADVIALSVVTYQQCGDATEIRGGNAAAGGGVRWSKCANKRTRSSRTARGLSRRCAARRCSGVAAAGVTFVDLLQAGIYAAEEPTDGATPDAHSVPGVLDRHAQQVPT